MSALARSAKRYARKAVQFAKKHKTPLMWGGGGVATLSLIYFFTRSSASAIATGVHAPRLVGACTPQFLDQQLAGQKIVIERAKAANQPALAAQATKVAQEIQAKIDYLNSPQGTIDSINALSWLLRSNYAALTNGNVVLVNAETFRKIYTHKGTSALDLISGYFYKDNQFTTDYLADHAWCQTIAAQVAQLGNDWIAPYYLTVYRYPSNNPNYAGVPIDPHADPSGYEAARQQAVESTISHAQGAADFGDAMDNFNKVLGVTCTTPLGSLYTIAVDPDLRNQLARFARDMSAKNNVTLPTTDKSNQQIPEPMLTMLHASIGAGLVAHLIDSFESHDANVNPCIRKLDAGLVFQMFAATLGTVIGLAIGPALSGTAIALQIASTVQKLAALSK